MILCVDAMFDNSERLNSEVELAKHLEFLLKSLRALTRCFGGRFLFKTLSKSSLVDGFSGFSSVAPSKSIS
jgi:hypothetical protein